MQIYAVKVQELLNPSTFDAVLAKISLGKQARIKKFRRIEDAMRTLVADVLVRSIIIDSGLLENSEIVFAQNDFGKPALKDAHQFHFNCSHSGDWVVCAVDDQPLGIDIEKVQPIDFAIAKDVFFGTEYSTFMAKQDQEKLLYFYDLWTLKEAYIKAVGKGLSIPLNSFVISVNETITMDTDTYYGSYYFKQFEIDPDYKLSVCAQKDDFPDGVIIKNMAQLCSEFLNA